MSRIRPFIVFPLLVLVSSAGCYSTRGLRAKDKPPSGVAVTPQRTRLLLAGTSFKPTAFEALAEPKVLLSVEAKDYQFVLVPAENPVPPQAADLVVNGYLLLALPSVRVKDTELTPGLGLAWPKFLKKNDVDEFPWSNRASDFPWYGKTFEQTYRYELPARAAGTDNIQPVRINSSFDDLAGHRVDGAPPPAMQPVRLGKHEFVLDQQLAKDFVRNDISIKVDGKDVKVAGDFSDGAVRNEVRGQQRLEAVLDAAFQGSRLRDSISEVSFKQRLIFGLQTRAQTYDGDILAHLAQAGDPLAVTAKRHRIEIDGDVMMIRTDLSAKVQRPNIDDPTAVDKVTGFVDFTRRMTINLKTGEMSPEAIRFNSPGPGWLARITLISAATGVVGAGAALTAYYFTTGAPFTSEQTSKESLALTHKQNLVHGMALREPTEALLVDWHHPKLRARQRMTLPAGTYPVLDAALCDVKAVRCSAPAP